MTTKELDFKKFFDTYDTESKVRLYEELYSEQDDEQLIDKLQKRYPV